MQTSTFTELDFWKVFLSDIKQARGRVLIQSPFVSDRQVKQLASDISSLTRRRVTVCVFVQHPRHWGVPLENLDHETIYDLEKFRSIVEMLQSLGVHVTLRKGIHAKLAVIDNKVMWEGSLNILSFLNTKEHMRRWESEAQAAELIQKHGLNNCKICEANCLDLGAVPQLPLQLNQLGAALAKQRLRLNLSQRQMAKRCGTSPTRISQIESGANITMNTVLQISNELGLQPVLVPSLFIPAVAKLLKDLTMAKSLEVKSAQPAYRQFQETRTD
jgi:transcriptional regulator with XRE-family HTH domain